MIYIRTMIELMGFSLIIYIYFLYKHEDENKALNDTLFYVLIILSMIILFQIATLKTLIY